MIKRTRKYVKAFGYTVNTETFDVEPVEHVLDGYYKKKSAVERDVSKALNKRFTLTRFELHEQVATMNDSDFYKAAEFGEDTVVYDTAETNNNK